MNKKKIAAALIIAMGITSMPSINANAASGRWIEKGNWYYINSDGSTKTGWLLDNGKWYYLKSGHGMVTGWLNDGGNWYYLKSSGEMVTGWLYVGGCWYYFKNSGEMATEWYKVNNKWYYFGNSNDGAMKTGWNSIITDHFPEDYYFTKNGDWVENASSLFYKVEVEKAEYNMNSKEIKFTFINNSDFDTYINPQKCIQVFKDGKWSDIYSKEDDIIRTVNVGSNSKKECTISLDLLLDGRLNPGKYRIKADKYIGYSEFDIIGEEDKKDIVVKANPKVYKLYETNKMKYSITNNTDKEISFGKDFKIQQYVKGIWKDTLLQPDEFEEIAVELKPNETYTDEISMEKLEKNYVTGTYRIVKEIKGQEFYAEFNVEPEDPLF